MCRMDAIIATVLMNALLILAGPRPMAQRVGRAKSVQYAHRNKCIDERGRIE